MRTLISARRALAGLLCVGLFPALAEADSAVQQRVMTPIDVVERHRISDGTLSPDGRYLLFRYAITDWKNNRTVQRYRILDLETGERLPEPKPARTRESFRAASWRPDGAGFATRLRRKGDAHTQVYFYDLATQSFTRLTEHGAPIEGFFWSPKGDALYFLAPKPRTAREEHLVDDDWVITPYEERRNLALWRKGPDTTTQPLLSGDFSVRSARMGRDGRHILYTRAPNQERESRHQAELWSYFLETGEHTQWTANGYSERNAELSPDGTWVSYIASVNERGEPYYESRVFLARPGAAPTRLLPTMTMSVEAHRWDAKGEGLFILGNIGTRTQLYYYRLADEQLKALTEGDHELKDWSYSAKLGRHLFKQVSAATPGEFHSLPGAGGASLQLTREHEQWLSQLRVPRQESVRWKSRGGAQIEGLLVYPIDYVSERRYPLVTIIHGGPRSAVQFGSWNTSRYLGVLAGQGYAVMLPNHRGGVGYGDAFMRDMFGAYFRNAHHDVMAGVDAMIDRGIADPEQLVAMGWSAGGHMVNKLITMTDRFAAASSGAGAADWLSMHGESDARYSRQWMFGGTPWDRRPPLRQYRRDSPLYQSWRVTTPTLFFVGESDVRVPPTQSILMHRGVRAAGAPTELFVAEDQPHGFSKPSFKLFKMNRELSWFAEHLGRAPYEPVLPPEAQPPAPTATLAGRRPRSP